MTDVLTIIDGYLNQLTISRNNSMGDLTMFEHYGTMIRAVEDVRDLICKYAIQNTETHTQEVTA